MEEATAVEAEEAFTAAAVAADFMEAEAGFTAEEDSPADTLDLAADIRLAAGIAAATEDMAVAGTTVATAVMDGADEATAGEAEAGAEDMVTAGAGDLAGAGRIGAMAGAIPMAKTELSR